VSPAPPPPFLRYCNQERRKHLLVGGGGTSTIRALASSERAHVTVYYENELVTNIGNILALSLQLYVHNIK
jgi:siroheme synthase (precorrin-2 oxidase/ferrochelatase)